ncbi:MAG: hypothetical protein ACO3F2_07255 [Roseiflexaceae bacterium]
MIKLMMLVIRDHLRSQRILVELSVMAFTALFVLRNLMESQASQATLVLYSFLMALYTTSVLADSNEQPAAMQRILAMPSREPLLWAIVGSALVITVTSYLLLAIIGTVLNPLAMPTITTMLFALPSVILVIITAIMLMLLMTPLVATTTQRLIILAIITIPIAWNIVVSTINLSMPDIDGAVVSAITTIWGLALWPGFAVYDNAVTPVYTLTGIIMHLVHSLVVVGLYLIIRTWFNRKSLAIA